MNRGDYVRFYDRSWTEIGQIVGEVEDSHLKIVKCRDGYYDLDNFIKSSPNIIDLIEVGDFVNHKKIDDIDEDKFGRKLYSYGNEDCDIYRNKEIKSIVTKEQFASMEYKIGE